MNITKDEYLDWCNHPVTQDIKKKMLACRTDAVHSLANGATLAESSDVTVQGTAKVVGIIAGLDYFLNIEYGEPE